MLYMFSNGVANLQCIEYIICVCAYGDYVTSHFAAEVPLCLVEIFCCCTILDSFVAWQ